ncbi:RNase H domain protein [Xylaria arbuscula]|nr:RNase H domain protein [Xylaria arbuscula]
MSTTGGDCKIGPEKRRGTGRAFPTNFTPSSSTITPIELFPGKATYELLTRYIHRSDPHCVLVFTDGACLNNGQAGPQAAWAVVHGPGLNGKPALAGSGRLENQGPFGDPSIQTSNRAELRAVIAALRLRRWSGEGFRTIVIATDSEYVTVGCTEWAKNWIKNGWRTAGNSEVKNKDLWEMLLGEVERWQDAGLSNKVADAAAKKAAKECEAQEQWMEMMGLAF